MLLHINHPSQNCLGSLNITGSKSETNRLLLLQALYPGLTIENRSNSDDSVAMNHALTTDSNLIDIHHAGTAMRFLTAFFATQEGREIVLTGSSRMQERPIGVLVNALRKLGAQISYEKKEGYPPLRISGKALKGGAVSLPANISSQYISALLLIAPHLEEGLNLSLEGEITSLPYLKMTLALLERVGVHSQFENKNITISQQRIIEDQTQVVESDWSSASYHFSCVALSSAGRIVLSSYRQDSLQGDAVLIDVYKKLGVDTRFENNQMILEKINNFELPKTITLDLVEAPDIAQTIAVSCYGLGVACDLSGLHTLKIKETDRLIALENELSKLGAQIRVTEDSLHLSAAQDFKANQTIATYSDHRMAMAFAPLALKIGHQIAEANVVTKSYPDFWNDLEAVGFELIEK
jgi:3-phosphoshikimate 1-carboxyvinyltransferase